MYLTGIITTHYFSLKAPCFKIPKSQSQLFVQAQENLASFNYTSKDSKIKFLEKVLKELLSLGRGFMDSDNM
jgi:hypothetical protein